MTEVPLYPCPFCGSEPTVLEPEFQGEEVQISCGHKCDEGCAASPFVDAPTLAEAVSKWNQRARATAGRT